MKKPLFIKASLLITTILLAILSCKKSSSDNATTTTDDQTSISLATTAVASDNLYNDAFNVVLQSGEQANVNLAVIPANMPAFTGSSTSFAVANQTTGCAVTTLSPSDPSVFPKTMTIDYGTGCTAADGVTRKGKIIATLSGKIRTAGTTVSITFSGYAVNGYALNGTYSFTSNSSSGGGINYTITVTSGSLTFPSGTTYTYSASETFTQTAGIGTSTVTDDSYSVTGSFSSSSAAGSISGTVTNPLVLTYDCPNITSGTISFVYNGIKTILDYGAGSCDNVATITAGLLTKTITLPK